MKKSLKQDALNFHAKGRPGKLEITPTKPLTTQRDLPLAYSPGVAEPCLSIKTSPDKAYDYTAKGNLVAVISNGTAVLGLGNIGAVASKPVMEGKAVLFKKFADIDGVDLELDTDLEVQFGGTGAGTFTSNGIVYGNGTSPLQVTAEANMASPGTGNDATTSYQVLTVTSAGVPVWTNTLDGGTF